MNISEEYLHDHPFNVDNIPFGIGSSEVYFINCMPTLSQACLSRCFSRIGDYGIDLAAAANMGVFNDTSFSAEARSIFSRVTTGFCIHLSMIL